MAHASPSTPEAKFEARLSWVLECSIRNKFSLTILPTSVCNCVVSFLLTINSSSHIHSVSILYHILLFLFFFLYRCLEVTSSIGVCLRNHPPYFLRPLNQFGPTNPRHPPVSASPGTRIKHVCHHAWLFTGNLTQVLMLYNKCLTDWAIFTAPSDAFFLVFSFLKLENI